MATTTKINAEVFQVSPAEYKGQLPDALRQSPVCGRSVVSLEAHHKCSVHQAV